MIKSSPNPSRINDLTICSYAGKSCVVTRSARSPGQPTIWMTARMRGTDPHRNTRSRLRELEDTLNLLRETSPLAEEPDHKAVNAFLNAEYRAARRSTNTKREG